MDRLHRNVAVAYLVAIAAILFCGATGAYARWKPEYANAPQAVQDWYKTRQLTKAAEERFAFKSCCDNSDKVETQFKVDKANGDDEWYWLKDGRWQLVPGDVIHWDEHAPDGEPVLFVYNGRETCFFPPEGGL